MGNMVNKYSFNIENKFNDNKSNTQINENLYVNYNNYYKKECDIYNSYFNLKEMITNNYYDFLNKDIFETLSIFISNQFVNMNFQLFDNQKCFKIVIGTHIKFNNNHSFEINFNENFDFWTGYVYNTTDGYLLTYNHGNIDDYLLGYGVELKLLNKNLIDIPIKSNGFYY